MTTTNRHALLSLMCFGVLIAAVYSHCGPGNTPCKHESSDCPDGQKGCGVKPHVKQTGPPGGGGGAGGGGTGSTDTTSTECTVSSGTCSTTGSSNNIIRRLTYSSSTGKLSGTLITNGCPDHTFVSSLTASCISLTFPATGYTTGPKAAPTLGRLGVALAGGTNLYGPFEAGFSAGFACTVSSDGGDCSAGLDVATCEAELFYECTNGVKTELFMDTCGGHASPYHHHTDLVCKYSYNDTSKHSPLIGVALDGYGIYGVWEGANSERPCIDACHGHTATVPGGDTWSLTTSSSVYHYHTYDTKSYPAVWTIGCFGPVTSVTQCKSLFTTCGDDTTTVYTIDYPNGITVDLFCPCFDAPPCGFVASSSPSQSASVSRSASPSASPSKGTIVSTSASVSSTTPVSASASASPSKALSPSVSPSPSGSSLSIFGSCGTTSSLSLKVLTRFPQLAVGTVCKI